MARIRTIKPEFFKHSGLFDAEQETGLPLRLAFAGLWTCADREGRFKWRPRSLKLDVLPYDDCDFSRVLDALTTRGFLVKYRSGEDTFGCIPAFLKHQVINNRETASTLPDPINFNEIDASTTRESHVSHAPSGEGKGSGREGKEEGNARQSHVTANALPDGTSDAQNGSKVAFDEPKPDTVDVRCLSESVGIFQMREQADMCRLLAVHVKESAQTVEGAIAAMVNRWKEYQTAMPLLEWTYGSSYKFFMSGNWNKPELWPRKTSPTGSPPNPGSNGKAPPTEAEAYAMWQQTSEKFKLANPWCGTLANAENES